MNKLALQLNKTLGTAADFLSPAGRRMYFPYGGILGQGAEAKSCEINATVGMAFEEDSSPLVMDCFRNAVKLDKRAFLYAGSFGLPKLREKWRAMEFAKNPSLKGKTFSNPVVTNALTHGIRICAELFAGPRDTLVCPDLFWDNYELIFKEAVGCRVERFNTFKRGAFDADAMKKALLAPGDKKILILNFPNNPTGYTATLADAKRIVSAVRAAAAKGKKIVVLCDDAYFGLVYEKGIHGESLFAEFSDLHRNVLAVKLLALRAYEDPRYAAQKREKFAVLKKRYQQIRQILKMHPEYAKRFEVMPFNSGYFMCVKPIGVDAEKVRRHLVAKYSVGTIVLSGLIRIAFSTVPMAKLDRLFASVASAIADLTSNNSK